MRFLAALLLCFPAFLAFPAQAKPSPLVTQYSGDRISARTAHLGPEVIRSMRCAPPLGCGRAGKTRYLYRVKKGKAFQRVPVPRPRPDSAPGRIAPMVLGGRPAGCPFRFCGCGASLHLFGRIIPALNLAANWLRFPRAAAAPKMAAARRGHVFVLERHIVGKVWLVHDSNSGGRKTRLHARSIAGYVIVNPRS
jgi:hypothetical protein